MRMVFVLSAMSLCILGAHISAAEKTVTVWFNLYGDPEFQKGRVSSSRVIIQEGKSVQLSYAGRILSHELFSPNIDYNATADLTLQRGKLNGHITEKYETPKKLFQSWARIDMDGDRYKSPGHRIEIELKEQETGFSGFDRRTNVSSLLPATLLTPAIPIVASNLPTITPSKKSRGRLRKAKTDDNAEKSSKSLASKKRTHSQMNQSSSPNYIPTFLMPPMNTPLDNNAQGKAATTTPSTSSSNKILMDFLNKSRQTTS